MREMNRERRCVKGKLFSLSPQLLKDVAEVISEKFFDRSIVSHVQPADQGDYFVFITVYEEER
jgi:hypothetical protein